jgi:hypothetical protein
MSSIAYYAENEEVLSEVLDDLITGARVEADELPAIAFATLVAAMERDPGKAVTVAALAVMRLAERPGGAS